MGSAVAGIAGIGALANIGGQMANLEAQQKALAFRGNQAMRNAYLYDIASGDAVARGVGDAQRPLLQAGQVVGKQQAAAGASGISTSSSQVEGVEATSAAMGRLDSNTTLNNAYREAWGLRQQSQNQQDQAKQYAEQSGDLPFATFLGSVGTLFGAAGSAAAAGGSSSSSSGGNVSI